MWEEPALRDGFDIIIEDGLHTFPANVCFFENSIHKVKAGGYYIIEDIHIAEHPTYQEQMRIWKEKYSDCEFALLSLPSFKNKIDNSLMIIRKK